MVHASHSSIWEEKAGSQAGLNKDPISKPNKSRAGAVALSLHALGPGFNLQHPIEWVWWDTPVIPALGQ